MTPEEEFAETTLVRQVTRYGCPIFINKRKTNWQKVLDWIIDLLTPIWMVIISWRH